MSPMIIGAWLASLDVVQRGHRGRPWPFGSPVRAKFTQYDDTLSASARSDADADASRIEFQAVVGQIAPALAHPVRPRRGRRVAGEGAFVLVRSDEHVDPLLPALRESQGFVLRDDPAIDNQAGADERPRDLLARFGSKFPEGHRLRRRGPQRGCRVGL